jgi:molybdopterin molybdotransferase
MKGFEKLTPIDEALNIFLKKLPLKRLEKELIPIEEAVGRITAEDIIAPVDLPSFNRSAVDGYAVKAKDTFETSQNKPKIFSIVEKEKIQTMEAVAVWTGNPLPKGADAVVMLEQTRKLDDGKIEVWSPLTPGENVSKRGEDIQKGEVAIKTGKRLKPHHIGLLAALGIASINVVRKPSVAIMSTGNELVELGKIPKKGQVIDVNRLILSSLCREIGAEPVDFGIVKDNIDDISEKIREGLEKTDIILTTGGTSAGHMDLVPEAVNKAGSPGVIVHGIAMRPGMPTALAIAQNKPIIILSGNPVAAIVGFEVFARPLLLKLMNAENDVRPMVRARLTRRVASSLGFRTFLRVYVFQRNGEFFAEPIRVKGSSVLSTMTRANGFVVIPENKEGLETDDQVLVHLFDSIGWG